MKYFCFENYCQLSCGVCEFWRKKQYNCQDNRNWHDWICAYVELCAGKTTLTMCLLGSGMDILPSRINHNQVWESAAALTRCSEAGARSLSLAFCNVIQPRAARRASGSAAAAGWTSLLSASHGGTLALSRPYKAAVATRLFQLSLNMAHCLFSVLPPVD